MNNLKSEILFNRALLWLVLSCIEGLYGNKTLAIVDLIPCVYNAWKSMEAWEGES